MKYWTAIPLGAQIPMAVSESCSIWGTKMYQKGPCHQLLQPFGYLSKSSQRFDPL